MNVKKILIVAALASVCIGNEAWAQKVKSQIVENGGTGRYKAEIVADSTCSRFTIYRPQNIQQAVKEQGKLPIILYANGGCSNSNIEIRYFLNEIASHGYLAIAIGPYTEEDFIAHWKEVMTFMYPEGKQVILANGEEVKAPTQEERDALDAAFRKKMEENRKKAEKDKKKGKAPAMPPQPATYPCMLLEALDWLTDQNANPASEYYHCLDLEKIAAMGQSCGGAQALAVSHDPRIRTSIILNSGIGDMNMQGATPETLKSLHAPMLYLIGGPSDIAYPNAQKDFEKIQDIPVVMINTKDGHEGTYYEKNGGRYAIAVRKWLDWQLKGQVGQSALFLDQEYLKKMFPDWEMVNKNMPD